MVRPTVIRDRAPTLTIRLNVREALGEIHNRAIPIGEIYATDTTLLNAAHECRVYLRGQPPIIVTTPEAELHARLGWVDIEEWERR